MDMTTNTLPTARQYADALKEVIEGDYADAPEMFRSVESFTDLYDLVDANEYLLAAEAALGYSYPAPSDPEWALYSATVQSAIAIVEAEYILGTK